MKVKRKFLYVLECEDSCYYIGQTNDLTRRFRQHLEQKDEGSVWTSNHKPIRIIETWDLKEYSQDDAINFENKLTIEYINRYGWQNVRGGMYIFFDEDHHLGLLKSYNELVDGLFVPKATDDKIKIFVRIADKISTYDLKKGQPYIYVLKLVDNKIFVGRSSNILKDVRKHLYSSKSKWTSKYYPIDILEVLVDTDLGLNNPCPFRNQIVLKYMIDYGWNNVRGGDYVYIDSRHLKNLLRKKHPEVLRINNLA